jgi:hypothetical protein
MTSPITGDDIAAAKRAGHGKISTTTLMDRLIARGYSETGAADHVVAICKSGANAGKAYAYAAEVAVIRASRTA